MYRSFSKAMFERFGSKVYKLSLDGGMTCPNRDGTLHTRGCIFCSELGSGDFAEPVCADIVLQLEQAKLRINRKMSEGKYIAYFQSFTNTYAPLRYLETLFTQAIRSPDVVALSVATRPDCLSSEVIDLLHRLQQEKPVWVELGLQTIHSQTVSYIRRGYPNTCFEDAVRRLKKAGLEIIVHMILGLPGESRSMMLQTAGYIANSGVDGIKLQLLHVLEGTDLAEEYRCGKFEVLSLAEYIQILEDCIRVLPPHMVIHRLTGDGPKARLLAPLWSGDKKRVLNEIEKTFARDGLQQGSLWPTMRDPK
jgi:radical SAM protein (TIGR01212 family)